MVASRSLRGDSHVECDENAYVERDPAYAQNIVPMKNTVLLSSLSLLLFAGAAHAQSERRMQAERPLEATAEEAAAPERVPTAAREGSGESGGFDDFDWEEAEIGYTAEERVAD